MKVKELIDILYKFDSELEVKIDYEGILCTMNVEYIKVIIEQNQKFLRIF